MSLLGKLLRRVCEVVCKVMPLRTIPREDDPYLERFYVCGKVPSHPERHNKPIRPLLTFLPTVYLHHFVRGDADEDLHNHPFTGTAVILAGGYSEERRFNDRKGFEEPRDPWRRIYGRGYFAHDKTVLRRLYKPGQVNRLGTNTFHRVDLLEHDCWSLFICGEKTQSWGFWNRYTNEYTDHDVRFHKEAVEARRRQRAAS